MKAAAREIGIALAIAGAASLALGLAIGLMKGEGIVRWFAYGLDIGGAAMLGLGFLTAGGESPRKKYLRAHGLVKDAPPARGESRLLVFSVVGLLLVAAGTTLELLL